MAMAAEEIEALITGGIPGARVEITDLAGDGDHYAARVTAESFRGLPVSSSTRRSMPHWAGEWAACSTHCSSPPQFQSDRSKPSDR